MAGHRSVSKTSISLQEAWDLVVKETGLPERIREEQRMKAAAAAVKRPLRKWVGDCDEFGNPKPNTRAERRQKMNVAQRIDSEVRKELLARLESGRWHVRARPGSPTAEKVLIPTDAWLVIRSLNPSKNTVRTVGQKENNVSYFGVDLYPHPYVTGEELVLDTIEFWGLTFARGWSNKDIAFYLLDDDKIRNFLRNSRSHGVSLRLEKAGKTWTTASKFYEDLATEYNKRIGRLWDEMNWDSLRRTIIDLRDIY